MSNQSMRILTNPSPEDYTNVIREILREKTIAFRPIFGKITGSATAALFLSQLYYWQDRGSKSDRWIYKTQAEWTEETLLSRREQETARKTLKHLSLIEEKLAGVPATVHYRINEAALFSALSKHIDQAQTDQYARNVQSSMRETYKLESAKRTNKHARNVQTITESTQENTTKNTTESTKPNKELPKLVITEEERQVFLLEYKDVWPEKTIREEIEEAESHYHDLILKGKKQNIYFCVRNWLRRKWEHIPSWEKERINRIAATAHRI